MASSKETISGVPQPAGTELGIFNSGGRHPAAMTGDANAGVGRAKKETELPEGHLERNICVCDLCQFRSDSRIRHFLQTIGIEHCLHGLTAANITYEDLLLQSIPARKLRDAGFQPTDIVKLQSQLHTLRVVVEDAMMIPIRTCATCTGPADTWQCSTCENWLCDDCINECERCGCYSCNTHPCTCIATNLTV